MTRANRIEEASRWGHGRAGVERRVGAQRARKAMRARTLLRASATVWANLSCEVAEGAKAEATTDLRPISLSPESADRLSAASHRRGEEILSCAADKNLTGLRDNRIDATELHNRNSQIAMRTYPFSCSGHLEERNTQRRKSGQCSRETDTAAERERERGKRNGTDPFADLAPPTMRAFKSLRGITRSRHT